MSEQLNTSTMKGNNRMKYKMIFLLVLLPLHILLAQDEVVSVKTMRKTTYSPLNIDLYAFCRFSFSEQKVNTSIINSETKIDKKVHQQFLNVGCELDFYRAIRHHFIVGVGYKFSHLDFNSSPFVSTGVRTHWLTLDTKYRFLIYEAGLKFGRYINGNTKLVTVSDVTGITPNCYNRFYVAPYIGVAYPFQRLKIEANIGVYAIPMLDADRIAYTNLMKTETNRIFFEVGLSYRLFSTRKYSKSTNPFIQ